MLSVTGRLVTTGLRRRWAAAPVAAAIFALQSAGALLLPVIGEAVAGAVGCVLLFGIGFGVATITLPHLLAERYGTVAYATLSGRIAMFSVADKALAPLGAIALAQVAGYGLGDGRRRAGVHDGGARAGDLPSRVVRTVGDAAGGSGGVVTHRGVEDPAER